MSKVSKKSTPAPKPKTIIKDPLEEDKLLIRRIVGVFAVLCIISTIVFDKTKEIGSPVFPIMCFGAIIFAGAYLWVDKRLNTKTIIILIFIAGFVLRLNYVIYTPLSDTVRIRQHDLYSFGGEKGHSAYIEHFYNNGFTLPDFNPTTKAQFYHPPLHHVLAAMWMRILTTFGMSYSRAVGSIQFLTLFYSTCCMIVSERIFTALRLKDTPKLLALLIIAFHPTFIILAGSVNNDILSILFTLLAVYTAIRWYQKPTTHNILAVALSIGLGMSTKLSAALVAIPIAFLFLYKLVNDKKHVAENILQYCIFGVVCLPLGLWFTIRNAVRFKVPVTYVPRLSETSDQYIGDKDLLTRLFSMADEPFNNIFFNRVSEGSQYYEYNPFVSILKTSVFGEYTLTKYSKNIGPVSAVLLYLNIALVIVSIAAMIYFICSKKFVTVAEKIFVVFYELLLFVNFIKFSMDYPHTCSMDFRYIVPTLILGSYFIGASLQIISEKKNKKRGRHNGIEIAAMSLIGIFCIFSSIVYIMLGVKSQ